MIVKPIRFNLFMNNTSVRSLDELREHFNIHDVLDYQRSGLLQRWLTVQGHADIAAKLAGLKADDEAHTLRKLAGLLGVSVEDDQLTAALQVLQLERERQATVARLEKVLGDRAKVIEAYHAGYRVLLEQLAARSNDLPALAALIRELAELYPALFHLDRERFYQLFEAKAPLVIAGVLMRMDLRKEFLAHAPIAAKLSSFYKSADVLAMLGKNLVTFAEKTGDYWTTVQGPGKRCLVLSIDEGTFVRDFPQTDDDRKKRYPPEKVNGAYLLLDGIEFMSSVKGKVLRYLEVVNP